MRRSWLSTVLFAFAIRAAAGEEARRIDVHLECSTTAPRVAIVLNGRQQLWAAYQPSENVWRWTSGGKPVDVGIADQTSVAVHFPHGRTYCRRFADFVQDTSGIGTATVEFKECSVGAVDIVMTTSADAPLAVTYRRELPSAGTDDHDVACREEMTFPSNKAREFLGVWEGEETFTIFLLQPIPVRALPLADLLKQTTVDRKKVALIWARLRGASNAIDVDERDLRNAHFNSLALTVNK